MAENEGVGETGEAIVMCVLPDICWTNGVPVPYQIIARFDAVIRQQATVRFRSNKAMTMDSRVTKVIGDEAGTGGGIISGVNVGYCRPITHSSTVRAGGHHVIHHTAFYWMNCAGPEGVGNTLGTVVYVQNVDCVYVGPLGGLVGDTNPPIAPEDAKELTALDQVGGFFQGFWDAGVETVKGVGSMAGGAWNLTGGWLFDSKASMDTWNHLTNTASVVWNQPGAVWDAIKQPYTEAWSKGEYGKAFGRGTFEAVALLATTKGVDKLAKLAKAGKVGEVADVAGKVAKVDEVLAGVAKVESKLAPVAEAGDALGETAAKLGKDGVQVVKGAGEGPPVTKLSQSGGLKATEGKQVLSKTGELGPPSHPLAKHGPEVNLEELQARVAKGTPRATKFLDRAKMEESIAKTIDANKGKVESWLKEAPPAGKNLPIDGSPGLGNLGEGFQQGINGTPEKVGNLEKVKVILKSDGKGGYVIQTAYPAP